MGFREGYSLCHILRCCCITYCYCSRCSAKNRQNKPNSFCSCCVLHDGAEILTFVVKNKMHAKIYEILDLEHETAAESWLGCYCFCCIRQTYSTACCVPFIDTWRSGGGIWPGGGSAKNKNTLSNLLHITNVSIRISRHQNSVSMSENKFTVIIQVS